MRLTYKQRGFFAGDFVISTGDSSFSIGDLIQVTLKNNPYATGEEITDPRGKQRKIVTFPPAIDG